MPRTLSLTFREAIYAQETGQVPVALLTIDHESLSAPLLISSDPTTRLSTDPLIYGTTSRGDDYLFLPFGITLPDDHEEAGPQAQITIDNVSREHISLIRSVATPPTVTLELVLADSPDTVEIAFPSFDMTKADYTATSITIALTIDPLVTEPFPAHSFDPATFPGLFS